MNLIYKPPQDPGPGGSEGRFGLTQQDLLLRAQMGPLQGVAQTLEDWKKKQFNPRHSCAPAAAASVASAPLAAVQTHRLAVLRTTLWEFLGSRSRKRNSGRPRASRHGAGMGHTQGPSPGSICEIPAQAGSLCPHNHTAEDVSTPRFLPSFPCSTKNKPRVQLLIPATGSALH